MRGFAADVGDKARKHALLELQHIGRGQVVRHQNQGHFGLLVQRQIVLAQAPSVGWRPTAHDVGLTFELTQQALDDLLQVALALAQIGVFHLVKLTRHDFELAGQGPLGVVQALLHPALDAFF